MSKPYDVILCNQALFKVLLGLNGFEISATIYVNIMKNIMIS